MGGEVQEEASSGVRIALDQSKPHSSVRLSFFLFIRIDTINDQHARSSCVAAQLIERDEPRMASTLCEGDDISI